MHPVLGVIRRSLMPSIPVKSTLGADLVLLSRLSLAGFFIHVMEATCYRREFRGESSYADKLRRYQSSNYNLLSSRFDKLFPFARLPFELLSAVVSSRISILDKLLILFLLLPSLPVKFISGRKANHD